jgi:uncharacterized protein HemX
MSLEQDLRGALRRKEPAAGFDDRVLSKMSSGAAPRIPNRTRQRTRSLSWAVAASVILASGSTYYMHNQQRARDEQAARAARDVVLALQIASETISAAQAKVEEITRYEPENNY